MFYTFEGKVNFSFNECWSIENDKNVSEELKLKMKEICPNLI